MQEILDYSKIPELKEIQAFVSRLEKGGTESRFPFWDVRTGKLFTDNLNSECKGMLLVNPSTTDWREILSGIKVPDKNGRNASDYSFALRTLEGAIFRAPHKRLQYLCDVLDFPEQINIPKLARQLSRGMFLAKELPEDAVVEALDTLFETPHSQSNAIHYILSEYEGTNELYELFTRNISKNLAQGINSISSRYNRSEFITDLDRQILREMMKAYADTHKDVSGADVGTLLLTFNQIISSEGFGDSEYKDSLLQEFKEVGFTLDQKGLSILGIHHNDEEIDEILSKVTTTTLREFIDLTH